jgi:hypothetical protein
VLLGEWLVFLISKRMNAFIFRVKRLYPFFELSGFTHPTTEHHILKYLNAQKLKFLKLIFLKML